MAKWAPGYQICHGLHPSEWPTQDELKRARRIVETGEGVVWEEAGIDEDDPVEREVIEHRENARRECGG